MVLVLWLGVVVVSFSVAPHIVQRLIPVFGMLPLYGMCSCLQGLSRSEGIKWNRCLGVVSMVFGPVVVLVSWCRGVGLRWRKARRLCSSIPKRARMGGSSPSPV